MLNCLRATSCLVATLVTLALCDIAIAALPTPRPGATVSIYAEFPTRPGRISFDASDNLYVGNFNEPGPPNGPAPFFRVDALDQAITTCGAIDDPDAIYVDRNGILGAPGSILLGGWQNTSSIGQITSVVPNCGGMGNAGFGGCLGNINNFAEDAQGRLLVTNATEYNLCVYENGAWSEFLPSLGSISRLSVDGPNYYVSLNNEVRRYDGNGVLQEALITTGELFTVGPEGWLYVGRGVELVAVDPITQDEVVILSNVAAGMSDAEFNSAGDLFVVQNTDYRILRVENPTATAVAPSGEVGAFLSVHPNPSVGLTQIHYRSAFQTTPIEVFDVRGRRVRSFIPESGAENVQTFVFDTSDLPSGVYFVRAEGESRSLSEKLLVLR